MCRLIGLAVFTFCLTAILVPVQLAARDDGRFANSPLEPLRGSTASQAEGACAVPLPKASVCKMSTGTPRMGTTGCEFMGNGLSCLTSRL